MLSTLNIHPATINNLDILPSSSVHILNCDEEKHFFFKKKSSLKAPAVLLLLFCGDS